MFVRNVNGVLPMNSSIVSPVSSSTAFSHRNHGDGGRAGDGSGGGDDRDSVDSGGSELPTQLHLVEELLRGNTA